MLGEKNEKGVIMSSKDFDNTDTENDKSEVLSHEIRLNILTNDLLRIMRNISPLCSDTDRFYLTRYFIKRMQIAGYTEAESLQVYREARRRFDILDERGRLWHFIKGNIKSLA